MGSGSALVAAARLGRRYVGYDLDERYVEIARRRVTEASSRPDDDAGAPRRAARYRLRTRRDEDFQSRATREGKAAQKLAEQLLEEAGFDDPRAQQADPQDRRHGQLRGDRRRGDAWFFDVSGAFTSHRGGLLRTDTVWKSLGRAYALQGRHGRRAAGPPHQPPAEAAERRRHGVASCRPDAFFDAIEMLSDESLQRLDLYAGGGLQGRPAARILDPAGPCTEAVGMTLSVACAVVRDDPPRVFVAEDQETLNWVLALRLIARTPGHELPEDLREQLRAALQRRTMGESRRALDARTGPRSMSTRPSSCMPNTTSNWPRMSSSSRRCSRTDGCRPAYRGHRGRHGPRHADPSLRRIE